MTFDCPVCKEGEVEFSEGELTEWKIQVDFACDNCGEVWGAEGNRI